MKRIAAYTTPRPDVCALVPDTANVILDLGCSDGSLGESLKYQKPGRRVCGIECSASLANTATKRLDQIIVSDLNHLDCFAQIRNEKFDCIIAADILEHLVSPDKLLMVLPALLTENGTLVVSIPNIRHHSAFYSIYVCGSFPRRDRGIFDSTHLHWFTLNDIRQLLRSVGFLIEAETYMLRVGDKGGGIVNKVVQKLLGPFASFAPLREFMTYQIVLRARLAQ